jgi:hypothetical protein
MAGKGRLAVTAIKMGVKYGPQVWFATQALRDPAKEAIGKAVSSEKARRTALAHAASLDDGSILKVYQGDRSHWVVLTGDDAIAVYPPTDLPLEILTEKVDRTKRIRPQDKVKATDRAKDAATAALRRGKPNQVD